MIYCFETINYCTYFIHTLTIQIIQSRNQLYLNVFYIVIQITIDILLEINENIAVWHFL